MEPATWTFIILGAAMIAFISSKVPLAVVAGGVVLALWATGVRSLPEVFEGFADPTVVFIVSLFIVIESLEASGITAWLANFVVNRAGTSRTRLVLVIGVAAGMLGAFISVSGTVGALLPVVVIVTKKAGMLPSKMLIPLAFLASGGSVLTLTASPVNIVVSQAASDHGGRQFGYFEFALAGIPLVVITILIVLLAGDRLLPDRSPESIAAPDPTAHAKRLREDYRMDVSTGALYTVEEGVAEVLVAPHSSLIGRHVLPGMTTPDDGLVVLGVRRGDHAGPLVRESEETEERFELRAGDAVLVQGPWAALERYAGSQDVIAVTPPQSLQRAVPLSRKYKRTLFIFAAMILLLVTGVVPTAIATMLAAGALIVTKVVRLPTVYRAVPWSIVILVGGMIPLSRAFVDTGSADIVADLVLGNLGAASPYLALLVICVISMVLGQFMSNLATVLVMLPIAVAIAGSTGASIQPFMMGLAVCGAASFITPVATAGNLIVMRAGGYHFGDYWKLGLPLMVVYLGIAVLYVPLIWPF
ncbi:SLC13 family permease [Brevibacterium sp. RIT 803]|uniref:SLC13 family permease n=1 Tax=Brevibacterium sp. RIT 803 TaxID=2810210 RepID=UPI001950A0C8|nr:SLC13/DASS family transporter [Brevibacterium sp. RIT 803]